MRWKKLVTVLSFFFGFLIFLQSVYGNTLDETYIPGMHKTASLTLMNSDTLPYSTVILYRPDNQLSRKYKISTNINGTFEINNKEVIKLDSKTSTFEISVDAAGHKKETFTFNLSRDKTHYFRIQDRNNYSGYPAFLEVIEVTEETFKREDL